MTVEILSRFQSPSEQKAVVRSLKTGATDIVVVPTDFFRDIKFKELGLVVIDEEQRFGVRHKESQKMRSQIDVLTLTTFYSEDASHGASRCSYISVIAPLPEQASHQDLRNGIPRFSDSAGDRTGSRAGQVYFVHNRVENIEKCMKNSEKFYRIFNLESPMGRCRLKS